MDTPYRMEITHAYNRNTHKQEETFEIHRYGDGLVATAISINEARTIVDTLNEAARRYV